MPRPPRHRCASTALAFAISVGFALANPAAAQETRDYVSIVSDATLYPMAATAVEVFGASTRFKYPKIDTADTTVGFALFCAGKSLDQPDIVLGIRPITAEERLHCVRNGLTEPADIELGFTAVVLVESTASTAIQPSIRDLFLAVAGNVPAPSAAGVRTTAADPLAVPIVANVSHTWMDLVPDMPARRIRMLLGPPVSAARDLFNNLVLLPGCRAVPAIAALEAPDVTQFRRLCGTLRRDGMVDEVHRTDPELIAVLAADPEAIALVTFDVLERNRASLRAVPLNGIMPSPDSINDGSYPGARPVHLSVKRDNVALVPGLRALVAGMAGAEAAGPDGYLVKVGLVPLVAKAGAATRSNVRDIIEPQTQAQQGGSPALEEARAAEKARAAAAARATQAEQALAEQTAQAQATQQALEAAAAKDAARAAAAERALADETARAREAQLAAEAAQAAARQERATMEQALAAETARAEEAQHAAEAARAAARSERETLEQALWDTASRQGEPAPYQGYLALFPQGAHADEARARIVDLGQRNTIDGTVLQFGPGQVTLSPGQNDALAVVVDVLRRNPDMHLVAEGHSDDTGLPATNQRLALERARAVVALIAAAGISMDRLVAAGFGASQPVAPNDSEAGRARNRRVTLRVEQSR